VQATLPSTTALGTGVLVSKLAAWVGAARDDGLSGVLSTLDIVESKWESHPLLRRPQCPACGDPDSYRRLISGGLELKSQKKRFTNDGGHRTVKPQATIQRLGNLVGPITGVVSAVEKLSVDPEDLVRVYVARQGTVHRSGRIEEFQAHLGSRSSGKGVSDEQAMASVLGEAVERFSGEFQGDEPRIRASLLDLGEDGIHPNDCMLFSEAQYAGRTSEDQKPGMRSVPLPFDPTAQIEWTPAWSLTEERPRHLPTMYLYYGYPSPRPQQFCWADSNGCAAGNTREEAILQGFLELIERDSVALWWYNRVIRPQIDLASFGDAYLGELAVFYQSLGREFWVLDITSDFGIPSFAAVSRRVSGRDSEAILLGFGAHLDPRIGVLRAVTEMNQMLGVTKSAEDQDRPLKRDLKEWLRDATISEHTYLVPGSGTPRTFHDYRHVDHEDLKEDLLAGKQLVEDRGMELLVLDQTRPDLGVPVVKVIIPGLRHFWARFAPGRLYGIPVSLGWLPQERTEAELNEIPVFF
ncbi:MAG: TOMM precursor leader peptide-binding protein, partial [Gemmatimonadetes bacterium]|nr:TOMM precursor leader peptide-binding protein [Gemmatimonadota bacterium]